MEEWKGITEPLLMEYVGELCLEKYAGRLTGTKGYDDAAAWLAGRLAPGMKDALGRLLSAAMVDLAECR